MLNTIIGVTAGIVTTLLGLIPVFINLKRDKNVKSKEVQDLIKDDIFEFFTFNEQFDSTNFNNLKKIQDLQKVIEEDKIILEISSLYEKIVVMNNEVMAQKKNDEKLNEAYNNFIIEFKKQRELIIKEYKITNYKERTSFDMAITLLFSGYIFVIPFALWVFFTKTDSKKWGILLQNAIENILFFLSLFGIALFIISMFWIVKIVGSWGVDLLKIRNKK